MNAAVWGKRWRGGGGTHRGSHSKADLDEKITLGNSMFSPLFTAVNRNDGVLASGCNCCFVDTGLEGEAPLPVTSQRADFSDFNIVEVRFREFGPF